MAAIRDAELRMLGDAAIVGHLQQTIEARLSEGAEPLFAATLVVGTTDGREIDNGLRDLAPARRLARAISAAGNGFAADIVFEQRADFASEGLVVAERAQDADAVCEQFARMPVGR